MDRIGSFVEGGDWSMLEALWRYTSLPPDRLGPALLMIAAVMVVCELSRIALSTEHATSRIAHVVMCLLTFPLQSIFLAVVLVHAASAHPGCGRGWINLGIALGAYALWFAAGQATKLVRRPSEGADLGFMCVGGLITFPIGIAAVLVWG
jgi:hypothetical protein